MPLREVVSMVFRSGNRGLAWYLAERYKQLGESSNSDTDPTHSIGEFSELEFLKSLRRKGHKVWKIGIDFGDYYQVDAIMLRDGRLTPINCTGTWVHHPKKKGDPYRIANSTNLHVMMVQNTYDTTLELQKYGPAMIMFGTGGGKFIFEEFGKLGGHVCTDYRGKNGECKFQLIRNYCPYTDYALSNSVAEFTKKTVADLNQ